MAKVDVAVIGAGAAGLTAGALLAAEGKRVAVFEASPWLGGRGMAVPDEGFRINVGAHLLEDSGSGITKMFEHVGKELVHGAVSDEMPVWQDDRWISIREFYSGTKAELKKVITALLETPFEELDKWDDRPLRDWMLQHTSDEGVIALWEYLALLECLTDEWYDHSASDNLYVRKMHYAEKRMAGYSFWPEKGWDGLFQDLADVIAERGGEVRTGTPVERVVIEDGRVVGVAIARQPRIIPNEMFEDEVVEAECVISTLPVWNVLRVVPEQHLPDWYAAQIRFLARDELRVAWAGLYIATDEPVFALSERELFDLVPRPGHRRARLLLQHDRHGPDGLAAGHPPARRRQRLPRREGPRPGLPGAPLRGLRGGAVDDVPGPAALHLAPPPPGLRPRLRRHPEAGAGGRLPAPLARAQRRGAAVRQRDLPQPGHRR